MSSEKTGYAQGFEASWQWHGDYIKNVDPDWVAEATEPNEVYTLFGTHPFGLKAHTAIGPINVKPGWWIVMISGEVHVLNPTVYAAIAVLPAPAVVEVTVPRVTDNDCDEITVTLDGKEIRGWSYSSDDERRTKMLCAREFVEGFCTGRSS